MRSLMFAIQFTMDGPNFTRYSSFFGGTRSPAQSVAIPRLRGSGIKFRKEHCRIYVSSGSDSDMSMCGHEWCGSFGFGACADQPETERFPLFTEGIYLVSLICWWNSGDCQTVGIQRFRVTDIRNMEALLLWNKAFTGFKKIAQGRRITHAIHSNCGSSVQSNKWHNVHIHTWVDWTESYILLILCTNLH